MSRIIWKNEYSVCVNQFDEQHMQLFNICNGLQKAVYQEANNEIVLKYLNELVTKTIYHFAVEEKVLRETKYEDYDRHKELHGKLTLQLIDATIYYSKKQIIKPEFLKFIEKWLIKHITETDKRYSNHLNSVGVK